jgi:hypothetical protein
MAARTISINRAPVLTLWAAVVAQRLGFDQDEALSLGKAVAGRNAQSKGRRLRIFKPHEDKDQTARRKERGEWLLIEVLGRPVPAVVTDDGIRALQKDKPIGTAGVKRYLEDKFGDDLATVRAAMRRLARSYTPDELAVRGYPLYKLFRPSVPSGVTGWGAKGTLDLGLLTQLAKKKQGTQTKVPRRISRTR